ncbi:MAG: O-antigen ligase family protein [Acidobacteriia bacterium]|nr:O-antigen ligase family protein [Terriglobia bacterium]
MQGVTQVGHPGFAPASSVSERFANLPVVPAGLALLRPVYWIAGGVAAGVVLRFAGIEAATITIAVLIGLWAFAEPRSVLWLSSAFMVYLFVFFQTTAPLGDELPEEFFYWGAGLALITAGLCAATLFSRDFDWAAARKRVGALPGIAMFVMLFVILAGAVNGLFLGNGLFPVTRQLFGCVLLPVYFFLGITQLRAAADVNRWLRRVNWAVALGSLWYAQKLSFASAALGYYYREQSPLVGYAGAVGVIACTQLLEERRVWPWLQALAQWAVCVLAILLMGNRAALAGMVAGVGLVVLVAFRRSGIVALAVAALLISGVFAGGTYFGNQMIEKRGLTGDIARRFFITVSEDRSFQGRMAQMDYVIREFKRKPVLGAGMGSVSVFLAPGDFGRTRVTSVDNGWGYLMFKMGSLGLIAFVALMALFFRASLQGLLRMQAGRLRSDSMALLGVLFYGLTVFWSGPSFFHFTSAAFFGILLAGIVVLAEARRSPVSAQAEPLRRFSVRAATAGAGGRA